MWQAKEYEIKAGAFFGGLTIFPYQLALGLSIGVWPCLNAPRFRLYVGPFKLWMSWLPQ